METGIKIAVSFVLVLFLAVFGLKSCERKPCTCEYQNYRIDSLKIEILKKDIELTDIKNEKDSVIKRIRTANPAERSRIWAELGYGF